MYYYRYQFSYLGRRKEQRISLRTKSPGQAKEKSLLISAMIVKNKAGGEMNQNENDMLNRILSMSAKEMEEQLKQLEIVVATLNGGSVTMKADPNNPADLAAMLQASKDFWKSDIAESLMSSQNDGANSKAVHSAKVESNNVVNWVESNGVSYCDPDQPFNDKSILYENYREFCKENGCQPCAVPQFFTRLHSEFPNIQEKRTMMGSGADKKRIRCINLTTGVFSKEDLVEQVALEKSEIEKAFYG
ncbi:MULTISPECIES: RFX family transcription factor [unclassified Herbaspirillum]|uniref:RFX family transcription factor n=1 Tax=unclassified Herbaspirillum TaxID=2624150 RepID=UPI00114FE931|nr:MULTISPECIES: RFX family transcription factor [unclassified Herbaspirillum]MBB5391053.1 hypothetical protein [Herbaspirillum sp. SJZ102]